MTTDFPQRKPALTLVFSKLTACQIKSAGGGDTEPPSVGDVNKARQLLRLALKAKLKPDLAVEDASHLWAYLFDEPNPCTPHLYDDFQKPLCSGLDARTGRINRYVGIELADANVFSGCISELGAVVPAKPAYKGVQPYACGLHRVFKVTLPTPESRTRFSSPRGATNPRRVRVGGGHVLMLTSPRQEVAALSCARMSLTFGLCGELPENIE